MERALPRELRSLAAGAREVAFVLIAVLVYFGVRGLTEGRVERAFANADSMVRIERALGIAWEEQLQGVLDRARRLSLRSPTGSMSTGTGP